MSNYIKAFFKGKKEFHLWMLFPMILGPIADYYLMEAFYMNPFVETRVKAHFLNIILFELIMLGLFFAIGRLFIALEVETVFFVFVGLMNYMLLQFRSTPAVPWDWFSIRTGVSVASNYQLTFGRQQILVLLGFLLVGILQFPAKWTLRKKAWKIRLIGCASVVVVFYGFGKMLQSEYWVSKWNLYPFLFTPQIMAERNGFLVTYVMDHQYITISQPEGYSTEGAKALLAEAAEGGEGKQPEELPNIIIIMDEAFSDLAVLGELTTDVDYMPFLHSLEEGAPNTITGNLNVSVKGGNTANSEFELLTGNTMAFLPAGSIPYQQYVKRELDALPAHLQGLGYDTTAIHPYRAAGWNRDKVYPLLGFDREVFKDEFTDPVLVRDYISDRSSFEKIIEVYEEGKDQAPQFIFNVTMQNHGGYKESFPNFEENVHATSADSEQLDRYLSLMKLTDADLSALVSYFAEEEDPTMIIFFGDHQPNDAIAKEVNPASVRTELDMQQDAPDDDDRYLVPYVIWANFDISEESGRDTSTNYLAVNVLNEAGVPLSDYMLFLQQEEKKFPILSAERAVDAEGNVSEPSEIMDQLLDYRQVQYYELFDKNR